MVELLKNDSFLPSSNPKIDVQYQESQFQLPQEFVFLALLDIQNLDVIFKIHDYDNFPHISDLIEEELIEIKLEQQLKRKIDYSKKKYYYDISSIYSNYNWSLKKGQNFHIIAFMKDTINQKQQKKFLQQIHNLTKDYSNEKNKKQIINSLETSIKSNKQIRELISLENKNKVQEIQTDQRENDIVNLQKQTKKFADKFGILYKILMSSIFIFVLAFIFYETQWQDLASSTQNNKQKSLSNSEVVYTNQNVIQQILFQQIRKLN